MTTATGLTCVDYLSPKFNNTIHHHSFQDSELSSLRNNELYEYNFHQLSNFFSNSHKRNTFTTASSSQQKNVTSSSRLVNNTIKSYRNTRRSAARNLNLSNDDTTKGFNFTPLQELHCNFNKLNLTERFFETCSGQQRGGLTTLAPEQRVVGEKTSSTFFSHCGGNGEDFDSAVPQSPTGNCNSTYERISPVFSDSHLSICIDEDSLDSFSSFSGSSVTDSPRKSIFDSDSNCESDDEEMAGYNLNNFNNVFSPCRERNNFRLPTQEESPKVERNFSSATALQECGSDDEFSDSELELAMINSGAFHTPTKNSRKRSSDCLIESNIKRPCIDIEKMHLSSLTNCSPLSPNSRKRLFVPIDLH